MAKCERCDLLVAEVNRTTKGRNDWFDAHERERKRAEAAEKELELSNRALAMQTTALGNVGKERDEWIAAYNAAVKKNYEPKVIWAEGKTPPPSLL